MKAILLLLVAAVAYLAYDDYSKREALRLSQDQIAQMSINFQRQNTVRYVPQTQATTPAWFQERLNQRPAIDEPVRKGPDAKQYGSPRPH
jgi:hypothetical protein